MNSPQKKPGPAEPPPVSPSGTGLWQKDTLTRFTYLSPAIKEQLGYAADEIPADFIEFQSRLHPEERDGVIHTLHTQLAQGHFALPAGFRLRHRDGSYRWIHPPGEHAEAGPDQPQPKAVDSALRHKAETRLQAQPATRRTNPETDLRRLQHELEVHQIELEMQNEELRAARDQTEVDLERYTDLYDFAPVSYFTFTSDGTVRAVNLLGATLAGLERGRLVGRRFGLFVDAADRGTFSDFLARVLASEGKQSCAVRLTHEGTVPRDVQIDGLRSPDGQECRAVLVDVTERNEQQQLLLTATRFAQATIDALSAHVCVLAEDGTILATNAAWRRFAAANPPATHTGEVGANYLTVCQQAVSNGSADALDFLAGVQSVLTGASERFTHEYSCHSPTEQRWFVANVTRFPAGGPVRVVVAHENITKRKLAEVATRLLAAIVESSEDAIISKDLNGVVTSWNRGAERLFGYPAGEMIGNSIRRLVPPDRLAEEDQVLAKVRSGEPVGHLETQRLTKDGRLLDVSVTASPVKDEAGKIVGVAKVAHDITGRRQAETRLRESEERYRLLVEQAADAIFVAGPDDRFRAANPAACRMFGHPQDELIGAPIATVIGEADATRQAEELHRVLAGERLLTERDFRRKDGSLFRGELSVVKTEPGEVVGIVRDVTERKQIEETLRLHAAALAAAANEIIITNRAGVIQWVNPAFTKTTGYTFEEAVGQTPRLLKSGQQDSAFYQNLWTTILRGDVFRSEIVNRRKDGSFLPMEITITPVKNDLGEITHFVSIKRDLTEQKRVEVNLRLHAAALTAAANEIVITDRAGLIQWVNPAFTKTTGYTLAEAVGQNPRILKSGRHDPAFYKSLWATLLRGEVWRGEIVNCRKDHSEFTEEAIITPVKDEHGVITHFIAIKQDITERKLLEAKFLRAQRLEGLGALAGGVAHDLNNVIAPILMAAEFLKMKATNPKERDLLTMIEDNSQRGAGMIRQILAFARGTAGERIVLQVSHLLKDLNKMMKETFPPNIRSELQVAKDLQTVLGDVTGLYQVLLNLCVNARDAMPNGGTLTLTAENLELDEIYVRQNPGVTPGRYVMLTVADTGTGIPPGIREKIFEPFFTTKEPGKGTGLGLATVKDIVKNHDGFIHVYSEVGVGTQFKIYLPAVKSDGRKSETTLMALPAGHGELVLVVDDEAAVREIVKATLESYGYRVVTAEDGTQAVGRFVENLKDVQVLLTDMQMPHMDGMATIRALRNIQPGLRIIAASGLATHQAALKATGLEVQGFINKPFTAASLLLALSAALHPK